MIDTKKAKEGELYLDHVFEGRQLVTDYIPAVLRGLEFLWGDTVELETTEFEIDRDDYINMLTNPEEKPEYTKLRVLYAMRKKSLSRVILSKED